MEDIASRAGQRIWSRPTDGRVAIFDLDRTLLPGASVVALVRALVAAGLLNRRRAVQAGLEGALYRRRGSTDSQVERLRRRALATVAGMEAAPLVEVADRLAPELAGSIGPAAAALLRHHLDAGEFCVLLSASPHELVERVGRHLGLHRSIGTRAVVEGGRFTGALAGPFCYGAGKLEALRASLGPVDLGSASAYADSASDLPLLRACGSPVAVNPDRGLRRAAQAAGWPVLRLH